jgi:hypothetical protein
MQKLNIECQQQDKVSKYEEIRRSLVARSACVETLATIVNGSLRVVRGARMKLKIYGYPIVNAQPFLSISADLG